MAILNTEDAVLKEGYLFKQSRAFWKLWKARYFVLRASGLSYYKKASDCQGLPFGQIAIKSISMHVDEIGEKRKRFCLKLGSDGKIYYLCCFLEDERNAWMTAILTAITSNILHQETNLDRSVTRGRSLSRSKSYDLLASRSVLGAKEKSASLSSSITDIHRVVAREPKSVTPLSKRKVKAFSVWDFKWRDSYVNFEWH